MDEKSTDLPPEYRDWTQDKFLAKLGDTLSPGVSGGFFFGEETSSHWWDRPWYWVKDFARYRLKWYVFGAYVAFATWDAFIR